ncbi:MAG: class I SAM-dependent methyltransferase [Chloroflexi bacterium]|nr:class I SAM-dependent methyltransferase [Chloroflexota bacterium]
MNDDTVKRLNQINREFYQITADSFDESRGQPWPGWDQLIPYLHPPLTVMDVGCGNGRFGVFLAQHMGADVIYHGIDNNSTLLERAQTALTGIETHLTLRDIVEQPPDEGTFDLVALFGVLHHIPGRKQRQDFVRKLAERVKAGGMLAFATWRFYEYERFRERITSWPSDLDVEKGDYLLDWRRGDRALRYCHYVDDTEQADLIALSGLCEVITYRADGRTNDINCYTLLRKENS